MMNEKPAVCIYTHQPRAELLKEICAGLEEEGVLYYIEEKSDEILETLCFRAASASRLGVGIGVTGEQAAVTIETLSAGRYIQQVSGRKHSDYRILGTNAARAVKKKPFIII